MNVLLSWLHELLGEQPTAQEAAEALTSVGIEVGALSFLGQGFENVVTAKIKEMRPHPGADRLSLCAVTDGTNDYAIVCGAKNMKAGDVVALGQIGAKLPNGLHLKKSKIRGEVSEGMLCSEAELGLSEDSDGIILLPEDTELGLPLADVLGRNDWLLELDLTPNRGDCLSLIGVAREVAASLNVSPKLPSGGGSGQPDGNIKAVVQDRKGCPRYVLRHVEGIEVKASPAWIRTRLEASGVRAINNGVDITNYVMLEWGQPQHAFDKAKVVGTIEVRRAKEGETLLCLDDVERSLTAEDLVIADEKGVIALAGVMGGKRTAVTPQTTSILLESAHFNPRLVRLTARRLGLHTESSHRFERFVDPSGAWDASTRSAQLFANLAGGKIISGVDLKGELPTSKKLQLQQKTIQRILGEEIKDAGEYLARLGFSIVKSEGGWSIEVPLRRSDIEREIDLVEEVARIHGYGEFKVELPPNAETQLFDTPYDQLDRIRDVLRNVGLQEARTHSFSDVTSLERFRTQEKGSEIPLKNPLTQEMAFMRQSLLPNLLEVWKNNSRRQVLGLGMYELGSVFSKAEEKSATPAQETSRLAMLFAGEIESSQWYRSRRDADFFDAKGALEILAERLGWGPLVFEPKDLPDFLHPGKSASVYWRNQKVGCVGSVHPRLEKELESGPCVVCEIDLKRILEARPQVTKFKPISQFPVMRRDLAFLASKGQTAESILKEIKKVKDPLLSQVELFDLYEGKGVKKGFVSLAYSLVFSSTERTLTDSEVDESVANVLKHLQKTLGVELRS